MRILLDAKPGRLSKSHVGTRWRIEYRHALPMSTTLHVLRQMLSPVPSVRKIDFVYKSDEVLGLFN